MNIICVRVTRIIPLISVLCFLTFSLKGIPAFNIYNEQFLTDTLSGTVKKKDISITIDCRQKALGDIFRKKSKFYKQPRKFTALVLPFISYNPNNGAMLGVGGALGWRFANDEKTKFSGTIFNVEITTKS